MPLEQLRGCLVAIVWELGPGSQGGMISENSPICHCLQGSRQKGQALL